MVDGDGVGLAEFAGEHTVALTRFAFLVCGDRGLAEDLVQDAFAALFRRFGDVLPVAAPVAYARRCIVNASITHSRRRTPMPIDTSAIPDGAVEASDSGDKEGMWRALKSLPERQRAVIVLRYYLGMSDAAIAAELGCRPGTVRSLAARAFATLRHNPNLLVTDGEESR